MEPSDYKKINDKILEILRALLSTGNWEASLFLRAAHKKLQTIYDQALTLSTQFDEVAQTDSPPHPHIVKQSDTQVYVSLYQSDPYNLVKWANTLKSIREYSLSRPIYKSEEHIQEMIRSKHGSPREGYVVIYVQSTDIIPPYAGKVVTDKRGHELLTLRDNSLHPENIAEFVHQGRKYRFVGGKLLLE